MRIRRDSQSKVRGVAGAVMLLSFLLLSACNRNPAPEVSFFYWKSRVALRESEHKTLERNQVHQIYLRYFDVDINPDNGKPVPVAIVKGNMPKVYRIIPVVFIRNRVFEQADSSMVDTLCSRVVGLVNRINRSLGVNHSELQLDCDWTIGTRDAFFRFLRRCKQLTNAKLSATIRLHQVKYRDKTGVPPVDRGVLMYYNMGQIDADGRNSVYDRDIALRYISSLRYYPLPLDIALPVFSWGIQIRQNQVIHLLNKMNEAHFSGDAHFKRIDEMRYQVSAPCFKGGYYFKQGDEVKVEKVSRKDLSLMVRDISKSMASKPHELIFYDLDSINFAHYDEKIYKKLAGYFR